VQPYLVVVGWRDVDEHELRGQASNEEIQMPKQDHETQEVAPGWPYRLGVAAERVLHELRQLSPRKPNVRPGT
jgi:hypothetical protein